MRTFEITPEVGAEIQRTIDRGDIPRFGEMVDGRFKVLEPYRAIVSLVKAADRLHKLADELHEDPLEESTPEYRDWIDKLALQSRRLAKDLDLLADRINQSRSET